jgi:hypothetical protein
MALLVRRACCRIIDLSSSGRQRQPPKKDGSVLIANLLLDAVEDPGGMRVG